MKPINITLIYLESDWTHEESLRIERGSTFADVLRRASVWELLAVRQHISAESILNRYLNGELRVGVYSELKQLDDVVLDGDRVELYRPLLIHPRDARKKKVKQK